jgi:DNA repair protein RadC
MKSALIPSEQFEIAEISLSYNPKVQASRRRQLQSSAEAYQILLRGWDDNKIQFVEQFKVVLLNHANKVLGVYEVSCGGLTGTVADVRLIFAAALLANATRILLAHNHPSGTLKPSTQDLRTTQNLKNAGKLLDIEVVDHLIVSAEGYYSFAEQGAL